MNTALFTVAGGQILLGQALVALGLLVLAFVLGWLGGRRRQRKLTAASARVDPKTRSASDDAFLKGLTHLMADHTDKAIEEFTRAVTLNSDTVETYVVLGNLFRQKGEIERAVHIRQTIIARPNLEAQVRLQAIYDLGVDYRKGGLFNRAVEAFNEVLNMDPAHVEAHRQLVSLFEEMREWEKAYEALRKLDSLTKGNSRPILAHYQNERGKELMATGQLDRAESFFKQAISVDKGCLDAYLHLGDLELARDRTRKALSLWRKAVLLEPLLAHLVINRVAAAEDKLGERNVEAFFAEIDPKKSEVCTLMALAGYYRSHQNDEKALEMLLLTVEKSPAHLGAHRMRGQILLARGENEKALAAYAEVLAHIDGEWASYQCQQCGFVTHQLTWKCPRCLHWDTIFPRQQLA